MTKKSEVTEREATSSTYQVFDARFNLVAQTTSKDEAEELSSSFGGTYNKVTK